MKSILQPLLGRRDCRKPIGALLVLALVFAWVHQAAWPFSMDRPYELEGDGARYIQMAIQMTSFHRLGNMPEMGKDVSRIYPPLLPVCLAAASLVTGEYYYSAHAVETLTLLLASVTAFFLARLLSRSWLACLCAGIAVMVFLVPRNAGMVLTEPLHAMAVLGGLAALLGWVRSPNPEAAHAWVWGVAICTVAATLSRPVGAILIPALAAGLVATQPREELRRRVRGLVVIGGGWAFGVIAYLAYQRYMESLGGIPLHTLLHAYTALLEKAGDFWPIHRFDPRSGLVTLAPEAYSLWRMFWADPGAYLRTSVAALSSILSQWFVLLFAVHVLRAIRASALGRLRGDLIALCDIFVAALFILNTAILCLLAQHPVFIPRMFDPWVACSLAVLAASLADGLGRLIRAPGLKNGAAFVLIMAIASQNSPITEWVAGSARKHRQSGAIARNVIDDLRRIVPAGETVIGSPLGSPDIAITIAGFPNMHFLGNPDTFRTQMRAHGIRYALIAPHVTPNANAVMADCRVLSDHPFNRLFFCPASGSAGSSPGVH